MKSNKTLRKILLAGAVATSCVVMAQQGQDSIQYGGWDTFRVGGYGEMLATFKQYGTKTLFYQRQRSKKSGRAGSYYNSMRRIL